MIYIILGVCIILFGIVLKCFVDNEELSCISLAVGGVIGLLLFVSGVGNLIESTYTIASLKLQKVEVERTINNPYSIKNVIDFNNRIMEIKASKEQFGIWSPYSKINTADLDSLVIKIPKTEK